MESVCTSIGWVFTESVYTPTWVFTQSVYTPDGCRLPLRPSDHKLTEYVLYAVKKFSENKRRQSKWWWVCVCAWCRRVPDVLGMVGMLLAGRGPRCVIKLHLSFADPFPPHTRAPGCLSQPPPPANALGDKLYRLSARCSTTFACQHAAPRPLPVSTLLHDLCLTARCSTTFACQHSTPRPLPVSMRHRDLCLSAFVTTTFACQHAAPRPLPVSIRHHDLRRQIVRAAALRPACMIDARQNTNQGGAEKKASATAFLSRS